MSRLDTSGDLRNIFIFDLDGTLANCMPRVHFAQSGEWDEFHALASEDLVYPEIQELFVTLNDWHPTIIITGRPEKYRQPTLTWLKQNNIHADIMCMRPDDDYTRDGELKLRILDKLFKDRKEALAKVAMIFEDRDTTVEAYRNAGYTCAQVRNGSY